MTQAVLALSTPTLCASDLDTTVNCEPRILDVRLGEALGFAVPRMIRKLIQRHRSTLVSFGEVCSTCNKPLPQGGRPGRSYYLNKRQALFITAKSDTERAALVTVQMVEVFDAVTSGTPAPVKVRPHRRRLPATPRPAPDACLAMLPVIARAAEVLTGITAEIRAIDLASIEAAGPQPIKPMCNPGHYPTFAEFDAAMDRWQARLKEHDAAMIRHAARLGLPEAEDRRRIAKASLTGSLQRLADIPATTMEGLTEKARIAQEHRSRAVRDSVTADLLAMRGPKAMAA